jgi:hypothetical protein
LECGSEAAAVKSRTMAGGFFRPLRLKSHGGSFAAALQGAFLAMRCPICHQEVSWAGNPFRPFCSERCKLIDLDHWLSERYRVSTPVESETQGSAAEEKKQHEKGGSG